METNKALLVALKQALNFVEHKLATEDKSLTKDGWDKAVENFRLSGITKIGIGRSYTNEAEIDLAAARKAISDAEASDQ